MICYAVQICSDQILVKGYGFLSFAKNISKSITRNASKILSVKESQELLDHPKKSVTDPFQIASKRAIQKTAKATGDLIDNEIADKTTKVSRSLRLNSSGTVTNEHDKEILQDISSLRIFSNVYISSFSQFFYFKLLTIIYFNTFTI